MGLLHNESTYIRRRLAPQFLGAARIQSTFGTSSKCEGGWAPILDGYYFIGQWSAVVPVRNKREYNCPRANPTIGKPRCSGPFRAFPLESYSS